jgi:hypothetical protein
MHDVECALEMVFGTAALAGTRRYPEFRQQLPSQFGLMNYGQRHRFSSRIMASVILAVSVPRALMLLARKSVLLNDLILIFRVWKGERRVSLILRIVVLEGLFVLRR